MAPVQEPPPVEVALVAFDFDKPNWATPKGRFAYTHLVASFPDGAVHDGLECTVTTRISTEETLSQVGLRNSE